MWFAELALLVISNTCSLEKKTLRTYGYSRASLFSAWAIKYFQSFPQVTYWQLDFWSSDPIQSFRELKKPQTCHNTGKKWKNDSLWDTIMRKGITLGLKGITGDPIISLGAPSPAPSFHGHEPMEACLWPHDVLLGTQTSQLPALGSKAYLVYNDEASSHLPR